MLGDPPLPKFYLLGLKHGNKESEDSDMKKAVYYFKRCLEEKELENPEHIAFVEFSIGKLSLEETLDSNSVKSCIDLIVKSAKNDCESAQLYLGSAFFFGNEFIQKDEQQGVYWFNKSSEAGNFLARYFVAVSYWNGDGVVKDKKKAVKLAETIPTDEYPGAAHLLGTAYSNGLGTLKDSEKAVEYFLIAAERGNALSQYELGLAYSSGDGVIENRETAFHWFHLSAENGYAKAQGWLGVLYTAGQGVEHDDALARYWAELGSNGGDAVAKGLLEGFHEAEIIEFPAPSKLNLKNRNLKSTIQSISDEELYSLMTPKQKEKIFNLMQSAENLEKRHVFKTPSLDLIEEGENEAIEYKETYEFNTATKKKDRSLRFVVVKEITGFLNTGDGVILIGVSDDQQITGIEVDGFDGNTDKFSRSINDFLVECCGVTAASFVTIKFEKIEGKSICRIEVQKSKTPITCKFNNKEEPFVRYGSSTKSPPPSEWDRWRLAHFPGFQFINQK